MKAPLLFIILFTFSATLYGQKKLNEYTASNGITYKPGDVIKLGRGSDTNGNFVYLQIGGWAAGSETTIGSAYSGLAVDVKKIKRYNFKGEDKVVFTVGGGNITNYNLFIEDAIATCEIADCNSQEEPTAATTNTPDKYEELKKLKELLDAGVLTQEEFDTEKKKILEGK